MHNMPPLHTFQEEDKARKEAEFQAIKDLAEACGERHQTNNAKHQP